MAGDLAALDRRFAVVGGLAVSVRAEPRLTRDVDVALSIVDDAEAEQIVAALRARGHEVPAVVEQEATGRMSTVRLGRRGDHAGLVTDLLFASSGVEPEIVAAAEDIEVLPGLVLPVATIGHLIVMKLLARDDRRRPADADDLRALAARASANDWEQVGQAAVQVSERGFEAIEIWRPCWSSFDATGRTDPGVTAGRWSTAQNNHLFAPFWLSESQFRY